MKDGWFGTASTRLPDAGPLHRLPRLHPPSLRASVRRFLTCPLPYGVVLGAALLATSCAQGLRDGQYRDGEKAYRLEPLAGAWSEARFSGNDLAWTAPQGQVIAVNATCEEHGDPSLKVLTDHLLLGFEDRVLDAQEPLTLDGRGALRSRLSARLDGVPIDLELTVMKKDGCVYDFTYTSPRGRFDEHVDDYHRLVASFRTGDP